MIPDYTRYGLKANPYRTGELDPLSNPSDENRLAEVDGLQKHKQTVEDALQMAVASGQPAFFLVAGSSGTGRSTVANWILSRYADFRGLPRPRLLVPKYEVDSRDDFNTLLNWFAFLGNRICDEDDIDLGENLTDSLDKLADTVKRETMVPAFSRIARRVSIALEAQKNATVANHPAAFAVCLEKVEEYSIIRAVLNVFKDVKTVGVFTTFDLENVGKEVVELFGKTGGPARHVIQLNALTAREIATVLCKRWRDASQLPGDLPFDTATIEQTLGKSPCSLGRVLRLMSRLIDIKLAAEPLSPSTWPNNPNLRLTADQIEQFIPILEGNYGS